MPADAASARSRMRMSSARLALLYTALVTVLTSALLVTVYLLTRSVLDARSPW